MIKAVKAVVREITPPFLYRAMAQVTHRLSRRLRPETVRGIRPSTWYNEIYASSAEYRGHYTESRYYPLWSVVADRVIRSGARRILDLGCGPGQFALLLSDRGITEYCGLDFSEAAIQSARTRCPGFQFHTADVRQEGVLEQWEYDCCLALEFLEHVDQDTEILRRIKKGSRFYATVPNFPDPSHVRYFSSVREVESRYRKYFSVCGVDVHRANPRGALHFLIEARIS
jgi:trans-aconitate methyltransferase